MDFLKVAVQESLDGIRALYCAITGHRRHPLPIHVFITKGSLVGQFGLGTSTDTRTLPSIGATDSTHRNQ